MNIVVCIKQVRRIPGPQGLDPATQAVAPAGLVHLVNPLDEVALEEALRIRERRGAGSVIVLTVGPARAVEALQWALAMGADQAMHVVTGEGKDLDPWATSLVLAKVIGMHAFDLVLFGKKTLEHGAGQVGTFVAELLDLPLVTSVVKADFSPDGTKAVVERGIERGDREIVECLLPAVFTAEKGLNRPRYPTWPARRGAWIKPIQKFDLADFASLLQEGSAPRREIVKVAPPKLRPKKILSPDSTLSPAARLQFILKGPQGEKGGSAVKGNPDQLASGIIDFLQERRIISVESKEPAAQSQGPGFVRSRGNT